MRTVPDLSFLGSGSGLCTGDSGPACPAAGALGPTLLLLLVSHLPRSLPPSGPLGKEKPLESGPRRHRTQGLGPPRAPWPPPLFPAASGAACSAVHGPEHPPGLRSSTSKPLSAAGAHDVSPRRVNSHMHVGAAINDFQILLKMRPGSFTASLCPLLASPSTGTQSTTATPGCVAFSEWEVGRQLPVRPLSQVVPGFLEELPLHLGVLLSAPGLDFCSEEQRDVAMSSLEVAGVRATPWVSALTLQLQTWGAASPQGPSGPAVYTCAGCGPRGPRAHGNFFSEHYQFPTIFTLADLLLSVSPTALSPRISKTSSPLYPAPS